MSHGWFGAVLRFLEPKGPPDQRCWDVIFGCGDEKIRRNQLVGYLRKASSKPVKKHQLDILTIPKCGWVKPEHDQFAVLALFWTWSIIMIHASRTVVCHHVSSFGIKIPVQEGTFPRTSINDATMVKTVVSSSFRTYSPQKPLIKHHQKKITS